MPLFDRYCRRKIMPAHGTRCEWWVFWLGRTTALPRCGSIFCLSLRRNARRKRFVRHRVCCGRTMGRAGVLFSANTHWPAWMSWMDSSRVHSYSRILKGLFTEGCFGTITQSDPQDRSSSCTWLHTLTNRILRSVDPTFNSVISWTKIWYLLG